MLAARYRDNEISIETMKNQNASLNKQIGVLVDRLSEAKIQIARQQRGRRSSNTKKCDHADLINRKETELKSKENQFEKVKAEYEASLSQKKKRLIQLTNVTKQANGDISRYGSSS